MRLFSQSIHAELLKLERRRLLTAFQTNRLPILYLFVLLGVLIVAYWLSLNEVSFLWLSISAAVVFGLNAVVGIRSMVIGVFLAKHSVQSSTLSDLLLLTGIQKRTPVFTKWWCAARWVMPTHLLMLPLKIGFAYGLARFIHFRFIAPHWLFGSFNYVGWMPSTFEMHSPSIPQMAIAVILLVFFTFLEVGLITAIGICWGFVFKHKSLLAWCGSLMTRIGTIFIFPVLMAVLHALLPIQYLDYGNGHGIMRVVADGGDADVIRRFIMVMQTGLSTLADGGLLASTHFTRSYSIYSRQPELSIWGIGLLGVGVLVGMLLYIALTVACLRLAIWRAGREGSRG